MKSEKVQCYQISVDCAVNDPVDVRCGGPTLLGFDFNVPCDQKDEMTKFIAMTLKELGVPVINITCNGKIEVDGSGAWTKRRIAEEISKDAEYLKEQAERGYSVKSR